MIISGADVLLLIFYDLRYYMIDFGSDNFYKHYFPNAVERTRATYRVYLDSFYPNETDLEEWCREGAPNARLEKCRLLKIFGADYLDDWSNGDGEWVDNYYKSLQLFRSRGGQMTKRSKQDYDSSTRIIINMIGQKFPITTYSLFGFWLPPRRREVSDFEVNQYHVEGRNQYVTSNKTFYFYDFKNAGSKQRQVIPLLNLKFLPYLDQIAKFLDGFQGRSLFDTSPAYFGKSYHRENGYTINEVRHAWATYGRERLNRTDYLQLLEWLDHSLKTSVLVYSS